MKIIKAGYSVISPDLDDPITERRVYWNLEHAGRTCYKSQEKPGSYEEKFQRSADFVRMLRQNGHEAMLEHFSMSVIFTVDRGVSHELVRHRIASFAQESTRYCNYSQDKFSNEITVIEPVWFMDIPKERKEEILGVLDGAYMDIPMNFTDHERAYARWYDACRYSETEYFNLLELGCTPQEARAVLPNSLKTEIVVTANMREWRHILNLRAAGITGKPHPQMLEVTVPLLEELRQKLPALFEDIVYRDNDV